MAASVGQNQGFVRASEIHSLHALTGSLLVLGDCVYNDLRGDSGSYPRSRKYRSRSIHSLPSRFNLCPMFPGVHSDQSDTAKREAEKHRNNCAEPWNEPSFSFPHWVASCLLTVGNKNGVGYTKHFCHNHSMWNWGVHSRIFVSGAKGQNLGQTGGGEVFILKILVVGKIFSEEDLRSLKKIGKCITYVPRSLVFARPGTMPREVRKIGDADIVVLSHHTVLDEKAISRNANLRLISVCSSGYDNVCVDAATRHGVAVTNVPKYASASVAEYVFGLLLCLTRNIIRADKETRQGTWDNHVPTIRFVGTELKGKTLGVIGIGNVGKVVTEIAKGFGMKVLVWTRSPSATRARRLHVKFVDLQALLKKSDFVSVHVPLTKGTFNLISYEEIGMMKNGAVLINTARGDIVNEKALVEALKAGKLRGAGIDVFSHEPAQRNDPLLKMDNVIVSPHIAGCTEESTKELVQTSISNIIHFINGNPRNVVNHEYSEHIKSA